MTLLAAISTLLLLSGVSAESCGRLWKDISFDKPGRGASSIPYELELANEEFTPYSYLDGFYNDPSTKGNNNRRATLRRVGDEGGDQVLELTYPKGCTTSACGMQAKTRLPMRLESATLSFKVKFGPNFDWVRGGKMPGLCGAECLTGCKPVSGLDGWSVRHMWRPCVWPPEGDINIPNCSGGKLSAYVYHMFKVHGCGDDFYFTDDQFKATYTTPNGDSVDVDYFQPKPEEWYTYHTYIKMNTAGDPGSPPRFKKDGIIQSWLEGPSLRGPVMMLDRDDLAFRQYTNVSIDRLYFSNFFGGSSVLFQAQKDETIQFNSFKIWEGRCPPGGRYASEVSKIMPTWSNMKSDLNKPTVLKARVAFDNAFTGGGCADVLVENTVSQACDAFELELNVRPSWGGLLKRETGAVVINSLVVADSDEQRGWFKMIPDADRAAVPGRGSNSRTAVCVRNYGGDYYLPERLSDHVVAVAYCVAGPAASVRGAVYNPVNDIISGPPSNFVEPEEDPAPAPSAPAPSNPAPSNPTPAPAPSTPSDTGDCIFEDLDFVHADDTTFPFLASASSCLRELRDNKLPIGVYNGKWDKCWAKDPRDPSRDGRFQTRRGYSLVVSDSPELCARARNFLGIDSEAPAPAPAVDNDEEDCIYPDMDFAKSDDDELFDMDTPEECLSAILRRSDGANVGVWNGALKRCWLKTARNERTDGEVFKLPGYTVVVGGSKEVCRRVREVFFDGNVPGTNPETAPAAPAPSNPSPFNPSSRGACIFSGTDFVLADTREFRNVNSPEECQRELAASSGSRRVNVGVWSGLYKRCWAKLAVSEESDGAVANLKGYTTVVAESETLCNRIREFKESGGEPEVDSSVRAGHGASEDGDCIFRGIQFKWSTKHTLTGVRSEAECLERVRNLGGVNLGVWQERSSKCWAKNVADVGNDGRFVKDPDYITVVADEVHLCDRIASELDL